MRILFVSPSYKPAYIYGGPAISVSELAEALVEAGHAVTIYTTTANGKEELDVTKNVPVNVNGVEVYYFERLTKDHTHISFTLWRELWRTIKNYDVVNLQSWWSVLILGAAFVSYQKRKPFFISPRGMLSQYTFEHQKSFWKSLIHKTIGRHLLKASYLHATSLLEWNDCKLIDKNWVGFIEHNLINLPIPRKGIKINEQELLKLGYLSRIDPKKGLERLFEALSKVNFPYSLEIAGTGSEEYINTLKELASKLKIHNHISWRGWKSGQEKYEFLNTIDLFILPSYNENFANSVIEALSVGCPVLVSNRVGLFDYIEKNQLGWICSPDSQSICNTLELINKDRVKINQIKEEAPFLIQKDFNKLALAKKYSKHYAELLKITRNNLQIPANSIA